MRAILHKEDRDDREGDSLSEKIEVDPSHIRGLSLKR
jgi:hypothetical protein